MNPGPEIFVAWRYLVERSRKWSAPLLVLLCGAVISAIWVSVTRKRTLGELADAYPAMYQEFGIRFPEFLRFLMLMLIGVSLLFLFVLLVRRYFSFFTTVSIVGVAVGTMALVMVRSVQSGLERDLREKIIGSSAHITVERKSGELDNYLELGKRFEKIEGVLAQSPFYETEVVLAVNGEATETVILRGIVPETISAVTHLDKSIEVGSIGHLYPLSPEGKVVGKQKEENVPEEEVESGLPEDFSGGDEEPTSFGADDTVPKEHEEEHEHVHTPSVKDDLRRELELIRAEEKASPFKDPLFGAAEPVPVPSLEDLPVPPDAAAVYELPGVLLGRELMYQRNLFQGEEVTLVSPLLDVTPAGGGAPTPFHKNYRIAGTFYTGDYEADLRKALVDLDSLHRFLNLPDVATGIDIRVQDRRNTEGVVGILEKQLGPDYRVVDWKQRNKSLFSALELEKIMMFLLLILVILVATFSIVGNLMMIVVEKAREVAVLKTMGAEKRSISHLFVLQGLLIGLLGSGAGIAFGLAGAFWVIPTLPVPVAALGVDNLPSHVEWSAVASVFALAIGLSALATIYPARMAANLSVVRGLRAWR